MPPIKNSVNKPRPPRTPDKKGYYRLGHTTFYFILLKYSFPAIVLFLIEVALVGAVAGKNSLPPFSELILSNPVLSMSVSIAALVLPSLILLALFVGFVATLVWYYSFRYKLGDNDLSFEKGLISRQEISIPFRQIQNADIEQSILFRIFNLADLVILTAGREDPDRATENESEIVMPALDADEARHLHEYLLDRANVQKIVTIDPSSEPAAPGPL